MNFSVIPSDKFKKEAKRLVRKYPSIRQELLELSSLLEAAPDSGTPLGNNTFKIRVSIKSKGKGKSGGARVITYLITENKEVYLLTIYDKAEMSTIDDKALRSIIRSLQLKK